MLTNTSAPRVLHITPLSTSLDHTLFKSLAPREHQLRSKLLSLTQAGLIPSIVSIHTRLFSPRLPADYPLPTLFLLSHCAISLHDTHTRHTTNSYSSHTFCHYLLSLASSLAPLQPQLGPFTSPTLSYYYFRHSRIDISFWLDPRRSLAHIGHQQQASNFLAQTFPRVPYSPHPPTPQRSLPVMAHQHLVFPSNPNSAHSTLSELAVNSWFQVRYGSVALPPHLYPSRSIVGLFNNIISSSFCATCIYTPALAPQRLPIPHQYSSYAGSLNSLCLPTPPHHSHFLHPYFASYAFPLNSSLTPAPPTRIFRDCYWSFSSDSQFLASLLSPPQLSCLLQATHFIHTSTSPFRSLADIRSPFGHTTVLIRLLQLVKTRR